mmetsp:Transcript_13315/g.29288  ORF Transcript_13315/g.29288 Transcript_13315/m.29288 type:complete len:214 (+) Transcript_13315:3905-4546(+)
MLSSSPVSIDESMVDLAALLLVGDVVVLFAGLLLLLFGTLSSSSSLGWTTPLVAAVAMAAVVVVVVVVPYRNRVVVVVARISCHRFASWAACRCRCSVLLGDDNDVCCSKRGVRGMPVFAVDGEDDMDAVSGERRGMRLPDGVEEDCCAGCGVGGGDGLVTTEVGLSSFFDLSSFFVGVSSVLALIVVVVVVCCDNRLLDIVVRLLLPGRGAV